MTKTKVFIISMLVFLLGNYAHNTYADTRIVQQIQREDDGTIKRSQKVLKDFQKLYPCPSTGNTWGSCPGWVKDHVIPLSCNGADAIENLQWQKQDESVAKDKWERIVYCKISK